ncbi:MULTISPECIES: sigma-54 interaction domain-containing protein [unclassified Sedimentibacter]|uniref:sigma-54 interaction domain-containing protein n=1 Tax=unclassified Sedimentibacter TaxID=2649220 RepID=UPI0027DF2E80|nr:sigma-54 dependent transcriptional regulator [Sedimentibacter sp. MB35-C1]WMJ77773.1 sigma-54 dependent transcriptional regulator [Sedimentibacter sp. MB35-C1]
MKDIKILIMGKNKHYIDAIISSVAKLTNNINFADNAENAFIELSNLSYDFFITDLSPFNKEYTISCFTDAFSQTDLIIVSSTPSYIEESYALKGGAKEYIDIKNGIETLHKTLADLHKNKKDKEKLKENLLNTYMMASNNDSYNKMLLQCEKVAKSKANVLLIGESGTGKEVAARYIHLCSNRSANNFTAVNCSSFTESLLESELFGYEQGSFTGAVKSKQGKFELADNGTLFLDEVGEINLSTQVKLLRVLETKKVERLGSNKEKLIDFRLISATNKDLTNEVLANNFREDFFYRISSIVIRVPSLRERKEDLNELIKFLLKKSQKENEIVINYIEPEAEKFLHSYDYPGNIRELKSIIDRMVVLSNDGVITKDGIPIMFDIRKKSNKLTDDIQDFTSYDKVITLQDFKNKAESEYLQWVLDQTGGNVAEASRQLSISSRQLFNKINKYDLKK